MYSVSNENRKAAIMLDELKKLFLRKHHTYKEKYNIRLELTTDFSHGAVQTIQAISWLPKAITADIFAEEDLVVIGIVIPEYGHVTRFQKFLKRNRIRHIDYFTTEAFSDYYDGVTGILLFSVQRKDLYLNKLITACLYSDFHSLNPLVPKITERTFFYNSSKKLLFHIYDDRGCDIWSPDKETAAFYYQKYQKYILDYDRKEIDSWFQD
ncbi:DUF3885 domain-containing protein [Enterococcus sp. BWR-S5]|uniref:DUF3885 domain-containing protein n=1 Tax=Enterococcus sp. BWR-S5 TaxID=2787714 RepID=UPI0019236FDE|nr:DUF3885 domain-containing protein [Enterococcus sp. BWR-S5]MBL1226182.1 DUF3885 domain-containing protein [Enterococcus sp. BWR-S5]